MYKEGVSRRSRSRTQTSSCTALHCTVCPGGSSLSHLSHPAVSITSSLLLKLLLCSVLSVLCIRCVTACAVQAVFAAPLASTHLLQLVHTSSACSPLLSVVVEAIATEMYRSVSVSVSVSVTASSLALPSSSLSSARRSLCPQERYFICLLSQLCRDCSSSSRAGSAEDAAAGSGSEGERAVLVLSAVRTSLAALQFAPQLCLQITRTHLQDAEAFLGANLLSSPQQQQQESAEAEDEAEAANLRTHWLFSALSSEQSTEITQSLLAGLISRIQEWQRELVCPAGERDTDTDDRLARGWHAVVRAVYGCLRVCCALMSVSASSSSSSSSVDCCVVPLASLSSLAAAVQELSSAAARVAARMAATVTEAEEEDEVTERATVARLAVSLHAVFHIRAMAVCLHVAHLSCVGRAASEMHCVTVLDQMAALLTSPFTDDVAAAGVKHVGVLCERRRAQSRGGGGELWAAYTRFSHFAFYMKLSLSLSLPASAPPPQGCPSPSLSVPLPLLQRVTRGFLRLYLPLSLPHSLLLRCLPRSGLAPLALKTQLVRDFFHLPEPSRICGGPEEEFTGDPPPPCCFTDPPYPACLLLHPACLLHTLLQQHLFSS